MAKRKILITGVCGCIGSHLLDELMRRGEQVIGVDNLSYGKTGYIKAHLGRKNFEFHKLDICDWRVLSRRIGRVDMILHTATVKKIPESQTAWPTLNVNAFGTQNMLRLARDRGAKFILFSTSDVYGMSTRIPFREDRECVIGPSTAKRWAYAVAKLYAEHITLGFYKDFKVPVVILRLFGVFSERSSTEWSGGHIPFFIKSIVNGDEVIIHGDGKQTRSMGYVSDAVCATILAMDQPKAIGEIINIGNDQELSVLDTAKLIHKISGTAKPLRIKFVPMKKVFGTYKEIQRRLPDLSKAKKILGYRPQVRLKDGLQIAISHFQAQ